MSWVEGEWEPVVCTELVYFKSPQALTPGFELTVEHESNGAIKGVWWLSDGVDKNGIPTWKKTMDRCIKLGCEKEKMVGADWVSHIASVVVGKTLAALPEKDDYGWKAKFIGIPKEGGGGGGFAAQPSTAPSFFAAKLAARAVPFSDVIDDDSVPF